MAKEFETLEIIHVPHDKNVRFGLIAKLASTKKLDHNKRVIQENFEVPSTKTKDMKVMMLDVNNVGQVTPIMCFTKTETKIPKKEKNTMDSVLLNYEWS